MMIVILGKCAPIGKHPHLFPVLMNQALSPEEVAQIYRRSKIVLNINNNVHRSVSPRTFEILATQTFQLMNSGQQSNGTLDFDRDLVQYDDVDDLIRDVGFKPDTKIEDGIARFVDWYTEYYGI